MADKISIIIPVYNSKDYLSECLNGVLAQTYQNIEIILVDDGSTDGSGELCDDFAEKDSRIIVIHQDNQGSIRARKTGVAAATGKYLCFVDSDDTVDADYISAMAEHINGYDLVTAGCYKEYPGQWVKREDGLHEGSYNTSKEINYLLKNMMKMNFLRDVDGILPYMYAKLYRTDIAKETIKEVSDIITFTDDSAFLYRYILKCTSIYVTHIKRYYYWERPNSICNGRNDHVLSDLNELYLSLYPVFDRHPLKGELLKQLEKFIRVRIEYALSKLGFSYTSFLKDRTVAEVSVDRSQPSISVIVPVYNVKRYLAKCLDSLIKQTFTDLEIICVDDGSTDGSGEILDEYKQKDSRIRVIHKSNAGYGSAMNSGLDSAHGKYIGFLESDDEALPQMYEKLYEAAVKADAEVVKGNFVELHTTERVETQFGSWAEYHKIFSAQSRPELLYDRVAIWSGLYSNDFLSGKVIRFQETPGASFQDTSFFFKVWMYAGRILLIPDFTVQYRMDNASSSINSPAKVFCICDEFKNIEEHLFKTAAPEDIWYIEQVMKYMKYEWNFRRLSEQYQYAFLIEMKNQFEDAKRNGKLLRRYWPEWLWNDMEHMISDTNNWFAGRAKPAISKDVIGGRRYLKACLKGLTESLRQGDFYLYGAGHVAERIFTKLIQKDINRFKGVIVTKKTGEESFHDLPVFGIDEVEIGKDTLIIIAVGKKLTQEIYDGLSERGYDNIIVPDPLFWMIWDA